MWKGKGGKDGVVVSQFSLKNVESVNYCKSFSLLVREFLKQFKLNAETQPTSLLSLLPHDTIENYLAKWKNAVFKSK